MFSIEEMLIKPLEKRTGFPVTVGSAKGNPLTGRFRVTDLRIENPAVFPLRPFLSLVEAKGHLSPTSLLGGKVQIRELFVHLREVTGVRAESGVVNVEQFRENVTGGGAVDEDAIEKHRENLHIRRLLVKVDQVSTVDYRDSPGERREYFLGITREFRDVADILPVAESLFGHCGPAGLSPGTDAIFAAFLPVFIWRRLGYSG